MVGKRGGTVWGWAAAAAVLAAGKNQPLAREPQRPAYKHSGHPSVTHSAEARGGGNPQGAAGRCAAPLSTEINS